MAIDLRNKLENKRVIGDPAAWESNFAHALDRVSLRIDARTNAQLQHEALHNPDPVMREQAIYEYADRNEYDAIELLCQVVKHDPDRQVRWDTLWAIEKLGGLAATQALDGFLHDADPEIAEWASVFLGELKSGDPVFDKRDYRYIPGRTFDETIFLLIHCDLYIRLDDSNERWGKLSLAPQGLGRVYGQAHACPNVDTREHTILIGKAIEGMHDDGSPHVENFLFRGFTERSRRDTGNFFFESSMKRPFFQSGRADDTSKGMTYSEIGFARAGRWYLEDRFQIKESPAIRYVRGTFQGWGYVNLEHMIGRPLDQMLLPGNAILSTLHDPIAGPLTNTFIAGTFKGKLNDWDDDGIIDVNSRNVYSTKVGEVDMNQDGIADHPGVTCCHWVSPF